MKNDVFNLALQAIEHIFSAKNGSMPEAIALESKISEDIGLSSLDLAELVALLEEKLNLAPFDEEYSITDIVTLNDLCKAYTESLQRQIAV